jgi:hypothetical protein
MIEKVELDPDYPDLGIVRVTDVNAYQTRYLIKDGVMYPGRIWMSITTGYRVIFFIPFPDGKPEVLSVSAS